MLFGLSLYKKLLLNPSNSLSNPRVINAILSESLARLPPFEHPDHAERDE